MPVLGILAGGLDVLCLVHAVRARQPYYWFLIILSVPLIGSIIYFLIEIMRKSVV